LNNENQKRIIHLEIEDCLNDCPFFSRPMDVACTYPNPRIKSNYREIEDKERKDKFPSWCPLKIKQ